MEADKIKSSPTHPPTHPPPIQGPPALSMILYLKQFGEVGQTN